MKIDVSSENHCLVRSAASKLRSAGFKPLKITASGRGAGVPIVAGMASIPSRKNLLRRIVQAMLPQVDHMFVCLNNYADTPGFLKREKVTVLRSEDAGDIRDNAKFLPLFLTRGSFYFLGLDDDLDYPETYTARLIERVEAYERRAIVGVHGAVYPVSASSFKNRLVLHYRRMLRHDIPVSVLGTGTVAAFGPLIRDCVGSYAHTGMADLLVAAAAKSAEIPLIAIARDADWLQSFSETEGDDSLYVSTMRDSSVHDKAVHDNRPWGFKKISDAVAREYADGHEDLAASLSLVSFGSQIEDGRSPSSCSVPWHPGLYEIAEDVNFPELLIAGVRHLADRAGEGGISSTDLSRAVELWPTAFSLDISRRLIEAGEHKIARTIGEELWRNSSLTEGLVVQLRSLIASGAVKEAKAFYLEQCRNVNPVLDGVAELAIAEALSDDLGPPIWAAAKTGARGTSALSLYGARNAQPWDEDAALSAIRRGLKGAWERDYFEHLRGLPDIVRRPDRWLDLAQTLAPEKRPQVASVVIAAERWPTNANILQFITSLPAREQAFWIAEVKRQLGMGDAFGAINVDLIDHGLTPIQLDDSFEQSVLGRLRSSAPLPGWLNQSSSAPQVSIIVAYFNDSSTIEYALRSISQQSYPNIQVLIIDDCSELPLELSRNLIPERMGPILHRHDVNLGPYACRNTGLMHATGDLICTHDADDWMHPEHVERQVLRLLDSPEVKAVYSRHIRVSAHGALGFENHGMFIGDGPMTGMFHRHVFDELGAFLPARTRGDMEFKARLQSRYGKGSVAHESAITLISAAWQSNSKRSIADWQKIAALANFKNDYRSRHRYTRFITSAENSLLGDCGASETMNRGCHE